MEFMRKLAVMLVIFSLTGCSEEQTTEQQPPEKPSPTAEPATTDSAPPIEDPQGAEETLADVLPMLGEPIIGDLDTLLEYEVIRVLTPYSMGWYFIVKGQPTGFFYHQAQLLQEFAREKLNKDYRTLKVAVIPVRRDQLLPLLMEGYGDLAMSNITVTPSRQELVDFVSPWTTEEKEILLTGPGAPEINAIDDLSGQEVVTRQNSSYQDSLESLNERFEAEGLEPVKITLLAPFLEDSDLMEMVNVGLFPMMLIDNYKVPMWAPIYEQITPREDIALRENSTIAMAIRKDSPKLKALVNEFMEKYPVGSLTFNDLFNRYLAGTKWAKPGMEKDMFADLDKLIVLFQKYGEQYNIEPLILLSFAYQESKLNPKAKSKAGAVGIMQVLPSTAADKSVGIPDISSTENNIHAGTKYLALLRDKYFSDLADDPQTQMYFTMAGYNAGPNRINRLRKVAAERGLDPNLWFGNVEEIVAAKVGVEPVNYVSGIYRYFLAYQRAITERAAREEAREELIESP